MEQGKDRLTDEENDEKQAKPAEDDEGCFEVAGDRGNSEPVEKPCEQEGGHTATNNQQDINRCGEMKFGHGKVLEETPASEEPRGHIDDGYFK